MATIEFKRPEDATFRPGSESPGAQYWVRHPGSLGPLELFEVHFEPNTGPRPHAHSVDEIIVVTRGELHFGAQVYGAGSSVRIPAMTLYSFTAGPEGVAFLNFRAETAGGFIPKEEFLAARDAARGATSSTEA